MDRHLSRNAVFLIGHLARLASQQAADALVPFDLTAAQLLILQALVERDGHTQKDLTERIGVEQATMANTLSRMERAGYLVRHPHPDDRRAQTVHITQRAHDLLAPAHEAAEKAGAALLDGLPEAERPLFVSMLDRLIAHAQARSVEKPVSTGRKPG